MTNIIIPYVVCVSALCVGLLCPGERLVLGEVIYLSYTVVDAPTCDFTNISHLKRHLAIQHLIWW